MLGRPLTLSFDDLLGRPLIERDITLNCVSNEVGGPYVGSARWLGVPLAELLREARPAADADQLVARSVDGMTIGTPLSVVLDGRDAMLWASRSRWTTASPCVCSPPACTATPAPANG